MSLSREAGAVVQHAAYSVEHPAFFRSAPPGQLQSKTAFTLGMHAKYTSDESTKASVNFLGRFR
jgi:hypothetical protein